MKLKNINKQKLNINCIQINRASYRILNLGTHLKVIQNSKKNII